MIIKKADNVYRSIGGRANQGGVERVNRDGKMEVLKPGDVEITPKERMKWNAKAKLDPRGRLPEEIYDVTVDESGNPMAVDDKTRTRLPRKHQYSVEARLSEKRGEKPTFHKSTATSAQAHGVTDGMVADNTFVDPGKKEKNAKEEKKASFKVADTFVKIASHIENHDFLDSKTVASISKESGLPVEEILLLEKVAQKNPELAGKYRLIRKKRCIPCEKKIGPGNPKTDDGTIEHKSLEEEKRHLNEVAYETGLCDVQPS